MLDSEIDLVLYLVHEWVIRDGEKRRKNILGYEEILLKEVKDVAADFNSTIYHQIRDTINDHVERCKVAIAQTKGVRGNDLKMYGYYKRLNIDINWNVVICGIDVMVTYVDAVKKSHYGDYRLNYITDKVDLLSLDELYLQPLKDARLLLKDCAL